MRECGAVSTRPLCNDLDNCAPNCVVKPVDRYCFNKNIGTCKIGNFSALIGSVNVVETRGSGRNIGLYPDYNAHYSPNASTTDVSFVCNTWASIVFHGSAASGAGELTFSCYQNGSNDSLQSRFFDDLLIRFV